MHDCVIEFKPNRGVHGKAITAYANQFRYIKIVYNYLSIDVIEQPVYAPTAQVVKQDIVNIQPAPTFSVSTGSVSPDFQEANGINISNEGRAEEISYKALKKKSNSQKIIAAVMAVFLLLVIVKVAFPGTNSKSFGTFEMNSQELLEKLIPKYEEYGLNLEQWDVTCHTEYHWYIVGPMSSSWKSKLCVVCDKDHLSMYLADVYIEVRFSKESNYNSIESVGVSAAVEDGKNHFYAKSAGAMFDDIVSLFPKDCQILSENLNNENVKNYSEINKGNCQYRIEKKSYSYSGISHTNTSYLVGIV